MVKIILVRHGETEWNRTRRIQGCGSDTSLSEKGKQQAENLALRLKTEKLQAVYSSPLERALDTARAAARYHQMEVKLEPDLREFDLGELEGVLIEGLTKNFDELLIMNHDGIALPKVAGGESLLDLQRRTWRVIQRLVDRHPDGTILVVSHFFGILTIICSVLDLPLSHISRLRLSPTSLSIIIFDKQIPRLMLFNDICHLPAEMR